MRSRSESWKNLASLGEFKMHTVAVINGVTYNTITAPVIKSGLLPDRTISVGNCIASTLEFTIMTTDEIPKSAKVVIRARLTDGEVFSDEWLDFGTYWIDKRSVNDDLITVTCYDAMKKGNQAYSDNSNSLNWPKPMKTVVQRCAEQMGVAIDDRTELLPNLPDDAQYFVPDEEYSSDESKLVVTFDETKTYSLYAYSSGGSVQIDWGDGTQGTMRTSSGANQHTFNSGTYTITLTPSTLAKVYFYKPNSTSVQTSDYNLKEIYVGNKSYISTNAFAQSYYVEKVIIANGVQSIGVNAFYSNDWIKTIFLPATITSIGDYAFRFCIRLKNVVIQSKTPPTLSGTSVFASSPEAMLRVPYEAVDTFKSTWASTYRNRITGYVGKEEAGDYVVYKPDDNDTLLDLLRCVGEVHGGNWIITPENKLRLVKLASPPHETYNIVDDRYQYIYTNDGYRLIYDNSVNNEDVDDSSIDSLRIPVVTGKITTARPYTISRVTMTKEKDENGDMTGYTFGDDTGFELIIDRNPSATQNLCQALYNQVKGIEYVPYEITTAIHDPAAELGDGIFAGDKVRSIIYTQEQTLDISYTSNIAAPGKDEIDSEFPYQTASQKMQYEVSTLKNNADDLRTRINQTQSTIELEVVKNGEIRSKFALDDSNVTVQSGSVTFKTNSFAVEAASNDGSSNFTLTKEGKLTCAGATIYGKFSAEYTPESSYDESAWEVDDLAGHSFKIALENNGFNFYMDGTKTASIHESITVDLDYDETKVNDNGIVIEDTGGNGITLYSNEGHANLRGYTASITANDVLNLYSDKYIYTECNEFRTTADSILLSGDHVEINSSSLRVIDANNNYGIGKTVSMRIRNNDLNGSTLTFVNGLLTYYSNITIA